ncbi:B-cell antigen receptor complex-associated protein beta chain [Anabas testudineus]|uniref:Ig-like domain-containing protein n=1 Tax=Anabas testudineus TaxID=64144 RepID=A0A3Q1HNE2_ANATE|nr:B-cell antigen receptor complex-associated protein beta chain [Anabas testudineus]
MHWLLAGCCGLALIHFSGALQISQRPRFYGVRTNQKQLAIYCLVSPQHLQANVSWYKKAQGSDHKELVHEKTATFKTWNMIGNALIRIQNLRVEDSGVYYCKINNTLGPGTHIEVVKPTSRENAEYRSKMKDGLIILQGLLLAVCVAAIILRKQKLLEKGDSIYEEAETDHIYEGLAIETCGGGLYEELTVYAEAEVGEAPWE